MSGSQHISIIPPLIQCCENGVVEKDSGNAFLQILIEVSHLQLAVGFQRADDVGEPGRFEHVLEIF